MSTESDDQGKEVKKWVLTCWVEGCGDQFFSLKGAELCGTYYKEITLRSKLLGVSEL